MKILLVSNRNPHFVNTNVYREKAIKELGHQVIFFEDRDFLLPGRIRQKVNFLQNWDLKRLNKKMIKLARDTRPDLSLMVGGFRTIAGSLSKLKEIGVKTVLWTTDAPRDFGNIIKTAPLYDHIFCAGTEAIEILKNKDIKEAIWLPFACDPDYHKPIELTNKERQEYARDLVFVGSFSLNRWEIIKKLSEFDLGIWGPGWNRVIHKQGEKEYIRDIRLNYSEWVKIYNASKIVIIIHHHEGIMPCYQASPKVYEALACKSFVLVDNQRDVFSLFDDGKHLVSFENIRGLKEKINYYLTHSEERKKIATQGYREVLEKHTYNHRIKGMLSIING